MSEIKHTLGPWSIDLNTSDKKYPLLIVAGDSFVGRIAKEEDARLVIAAPDLLDALIALYAVARVDHDESYSAVTNAAAVIAKATGEQS